MKYTECDRCGKTEERKQEYEMDIKGVSVKYDSGPFPDITADLCGKCRTDLNNLIKEKFPRKA